MEYSQDKKKKNIIIIGVLLVVIVLIVVLLVVRNNKTYTVTFNDGYSSSEVEVKNNHVIEKPMDPEKDGYKFIGWYKDGIEFDFSTKINGNITLKAKFEKEDKPIINKITTTTTTTTVAETTTKNYTSIKTYKSTAKRQEQPQTTAKQTQAPTTTTIKAVTYSYVWTDVKDSSIGQSKLYIKNNNTGSYVSGTVTITYHNGASESISVPSTGYLIVKSTVASVTNVKGN